jgi:amino acid transporter
MHWMTQEAETDTKLQRSLSLPLITLYGLGTILGAGIYVLIGEVAAAAGPGAPLAFLLAAVIAGMTGLSYAELSSRFPYSGGEAIYVERAFGQLWLSGFTGWAVVLTGIVSAATIASGFAGYLQIFVAIPDWLAMCLLVFALAGIATWGISESVWAASIMTLIETGGLVLVVWLAGDSLATLPERWHELIPETTVLAWAGISSGAFLAFYAFVGFEDMVNVAEEVKDPTRTMPLAIVLALSIATILYVLVALVAVLAVPIEELAASSAPLVTILGSAGPSFRYTITVISIIAISNTALAQLIMTSRMIYGMSGQGTAPKFFRHVHPSTRTPVRGTLFVAVIILILALWLSLVTLAQATSAIVLAVFILVNTALIRIKLKSSAPTEAKTYPMWVPVTACALCCALLGARVLGQ